MDVLELKNIGQIKDARLELGDLTVLVGPQATGKSITLQLLQGMVDLPRIQQQMKLHGLDWGGQLDPFLDLLLGEGMRGVWRDDSVLLFNRRKANLARKPRVSKKNLGKRDAPAMFYIPAQRVLSMRDGWPRNFMDYSPGDPFAVRDFSERMRLLMDMEFVQGDLLFPRVNRLKAQYRDRIDTHLFGGFELKVDRSRPQKRLVLHQTAGDKQDLPFMVWSAGQREFMPLLMGLYWLMPPGAMAKRDGCDWVVIEELEMGLHPKAINLILLLVLELMHRGYKVCLSTHSPQVLELVWALSNLACNKADASLLNHLFEVRGKALKDVFATALKKKTRVHYFDRSGEVRDISRLDPDSDDENMAEWGGLLEFSGRANEAVASAVANGPRRKA